MVQIWDRLLGQLLDPRTAKKRPGEKTFFRIVILLTCSVSRKPFKSSFEWFETDTPEFRKWLFIYTKKEMFKCENTKSPTCSVFS